MNSIIIDNFISGVQLFNQGEILKGHDKWEKLWKVGDKKLRKWIKGWIQFSGCILNVLAGKPGGAIYLAKKTDENLKQDEISPCFIDVESAISDINILQRLLEDNVSSKEKIKAARQIRIKFKQEKNFKIPK
ncbi:MAG: DUF309 domain-containing protein [Fidelibacterota bacterium]